MQRKLTQTKDGLAFILTPAELEQMGLDGGEAEVEIIIRDGVVHLRAAKENAPGSFEALLDRALKDHDSAFRRLAD